MKKLLSLFILMLLPMVASAQTQTSMFCDGRSWKYEHSKPDWQSLTEEQILSGDYLNMERVTYSYWLRVEGDELFDGRQCKRIVYDGYNGTGLYGYGYEEDGRVMVYAILNEPAFYALFPTEQWVMLYDFNAAKDSHCDMGAFGSRDLIVSVEGTLKVSDTDKRYIGLSNAQHPTWPLLYAVDGIGCPSGLYEFENIIDDGSSSRFVGCYDGDVCIFSAEDFNALTTPTDDCLPFVELGKSWHGVSSTFPQEKIKEWDFCIQQVKEEEANIEGKPEGQTYMKLADFLIREENHKVYLYHPYINVEFLMFDFSLKEGDTYETYSISDQEIVTYKVLSVGDYTEGPTITRYEYDEKSNSVIEHQRYLRKWIVCRVDNGTTKTWIEGVGSLEGPFGNIIDDRANTLGYLAYVLYNGQHDYYLPFSFYDDLNEGLVWNRGCKLPTGKTGNRDEHIDQLTYELEGDRLHVYGDVFTNCGPNHYIYFFEKPTDKPSVHELCYRILDVEPIATCAFLHATDFYVSGFDQSLNYIVVDNQGVEHPVINKNQQPTYRPFIEDGKVWTYHYYNDFTGKEFYESLTVSGDTVIDDKSYKKIVDVTTGRVDCALREEGRKVYATYPHYSGEKLIYDFGLNVGDAFPLYEGSDPSAWATVVSVDTIVVGSRAFRALDVRPNNTKDWPNWWVEGIGGMYHLTSNSPMPGNFYYFSSCQLLGNTLFTSRDFQTLGTVPSPEKVIPMVEEGRIWYCQDIYPDDPHSVDSGYYEHDSAYYVIPRTYVLRGDTVIGENTYKKMYCNEKYRCAMRQDDQKVFTVFNGTQELLSYDFSMEKGMSIMRQTETLKIKDVDTVFVEGVARKRLMVYMDFADTEMLVDIWVEGIGSMGGPIATCLLFEATTPVHDMVSCIQDGECIFTKQDFYAPATKSDIKIAYRPFVEEGKVWKVGGKDSGNPVKFVTYYYFDGDTIIGGKTCKQMMCQRYLSPDCPHSSYYDFWAQLPSLSKVGAWYEEDKKVYVCMEGTQGMQMLYDFSLEANDTLILNDYQPYFTVRPKQTGGIKGFKGVYRDIMLCGQDIYITTWLEGVGGIDGPLRNVYPENESNPQFLMSCTVGDEVIYMNDEYEDGATPEGARKGRFDFTHTIKPKPKAPIKREESDACISSAEREVARQNVKAPKVKAPIKREESDAGQSVYGEYNDLRLDIHLNPLDEAYQVTIADESGQVVYEKTVNAGSIVGLNIDISAYLEGRYTVTVENNNESFTGEFDAQTAGVGDAVRLNNNGKIVNDNIYNLQGQRLSSLQKGLNIVNGQKVFVK